VRLGELFMEAGAPAGVLNVVNGDKVAVDAILHHPESRPSASSARRRSRTTSTHRRANGKRVQAMGGAKNHGIVMPDADMDQVVEGPDRRRLRLGRRALHGAAGGRAGRQKTATSCASA
jgi:malonate-semialdehyde dehydrogenase (acetylating)/methylmalonate-semialdehyde dehydrogenase